ncbi:ribonuclease H-like domain-containing protein [Tanacetum coccineum]
MTQLSKSHKPTERRLIPLGLRRSTKIKTLRIKEIDHESIKNLCFSTTLNKSSEPKTFYKASQNPKWIEAMNLEWRLCIESYWDGIFIAILVYVDDIMITRNNGHEIDKFKRFLSSKFKIKDLGLLKYFLGIEVLEIENGLCLSQRKYCLELLSEYGLLACKPGATPLLQNVMFNHEESDNVLRYLKNALGTGVQFYKGKSLYLHAYSDAD